MISTPSLSRPRFFDHRHFCSLSFFSFLTNRVNPPASDRGAQSILIETGTRHSSGSYQISNSCPRFAIAGSSLRPTVLDPSSGRVLSQCHRWSVALPTGSPCLKVTHPYMQTDRQTDQTFFFYPQRPVDCLPSTDCPGCDCRGQYLCHQVISVCITA